MWRGRRGEVRGVIREISGVCFVAFMDGEGEWCPRLHVMSVCVVEYEKLLLHMLYGNVSRYMVEKKSKKVQDTRVRKKIGYQMTG